MGTVHLIELEPIESRYTSIWKHTLPALIETHGMKVNVIAGEARGSDTATEGAFLNFTKTNEFKASQAIILARAFDDGTVTDGDVLLFTDAWNPVILMARYMIDLTGKDVQIASMWHAGSYDPQDFLGRKIPSKTWSFNAERAMFYAADVNFFATQFHVDMFCNTLGVDRRHSTIHKAGFPFEYIAEIAQCATPADLVKEDIVCFPHRLSEEKNYNLFKQLEVMLPQYKFIACQESSLTKDEYYNILARSKLLFSANKQETLGIGTYEGLALKAIPMVPDYLSYSEMYNVLFKYDPAEMRDPQAMADLIVHYMNNYDKLAPRLDKEFERISATFFTSTSMMTTLKELM
jgi:glycosyltransferase involved in cell wall biosynthesis